MPLLINRNSESRSERRKLQTVSHSQSSPTGISFVQFMKRRRSLNGCISKQAISTTTSTSSCAITYMDAPSDAPWIVECSPTFQDWWTNNNTSEQQSNIEIVDSKDTMINSSFENDKNDTDDSVSVECNTLDRNDNSNIQSAPAATTTTTTMNHSILEKTENEVTIFESCKFRNIGLENWEKSRKEWRKEKPLLFHNNNDSDENQQKDGNVTNTNTNTTAMIRPGGASFPSHQKLSGKQRNLIIQELKKVNSKYQLPVVMSLHDIVQMFVSFW